MDAAANTSGDGSLLQDAAKASGNMAIRAIIVRLLANAVFNSPVNRRLNAKIR